MWFSQSTLLETNLFPSFNINSISIEEGCDVNNFLAFTWNFFNFLEIIAKLKLKIYSSNVALVALAVDPVIWFAFGAATRDGYFITILCKILSIY